MKIKLFYFIISCVFAVITSTNNKIDKVHWQFKEKGQNILLLEIQESKIKNYTSIFINKIEPENDFTNKIKGKFEIFYENVFHAEISEEINRNNKEAEITGRELPYYTILYRYKDRVLRI